MKRRIIDDDKWRALIAKQCMSMWDGCACKHDRDHEGLHECVSEDCDCTWTDEQAAEFMASLKREYKFKK